MDSSIFKGILSSLPMYQQEELAGPTAPRVESARRSKHMGATRRPRATVVAERRAANRVAKKSRRANRG